MAAHDWDVITSALRSFPGKLIEVGQVSPWSDDGSFLTLFLVAGPAFECYKLEITIVVSTDKTEIIFLDPGGDRESAQSIAEAVSRANSAVSCSGLVGPASVRSAILRLCDELCIELDAKQSAAMRALGGCQEGYAKDVDATLPGFFPPLAPPQLDRNCSVATSNFSFESDGCRLDSEDGSPCMRAQTILQKEISGSGPSVEDVILWNAIVDGLKKLSQDIGSLGKLLDVHSSPPWDGREVLLEVELHSRDANFEWQHLQIVFITSSKRTRIELKGAQVIPETVKHAVEDLNIHGEWGTGPLSASCALREFCQSLMLELEEHESKALKALGDVNATAHLAMRQKGTGEVTEELAGEIKAVEALKTQLGFITYQIEHIKGRMADGQRAELQHELYMLQRSHSVVSAEKDAANAAVQAVLKQCTQASGSVDVKVEIQKLPSQSLRGHGNDSAIRQIKTALSQSGPWAHYAAHQFSIMLSREQELQDDYIVLYHSYSVAALLYEVQAEIARHVYSLPSDSAPVPRLSTADPGICRTLQDLKSLGGRDGDAKFMALGLSASCSLFASGSEAPPLTCFQGGYSANNVIFHQLLVKHLQTCGCGDPERIANEIDAIAKKHGVGIDRGNQAHWNRPQAGLTGYMLQIFIRRSICEKFTYPSEPFGRVISGTMCDYLEKTARADGQARILFDPETFLDPKNVTLFHYCARPLQSCMEADVPGSRGALIKDLRTILSPILQRTPPETLAAAFGQRGVKSAKSKARR